MVAGKGLARFSPAHRLRQRTEFQSVQRRGTRRTSAHFVVLCQPRSGGVPRLGLTVSRRVGSAVIRNRVKRLIREVFRRRARSLPPDDQVVIARRGAGSLAFAEVARELLPLLQGGSARGAGRGLDDGGKANLG